MERLNKNYFDLIDTILESLEKGRIIPVLILVYAGIDNFSNLAETEVNKESGKIFKDWVKKWMLSQGKLPCSEVDLWSARCGLLHQQISESDLTNSGKAKQIYYSHGGANIEALQSKIDRAAKMAIVVEIEQLIMSFKTGMIDCINEIEKEPEWKASFDNKSIKLFVTISELK